MVRWPTRGCSRSASRACKASYTFTSRLFVRVIGQYVATTNEPRLFKATVDPRAGAFSGSALFAYKLNWQSVMFVGYGDDRELSPTASRAVRTAILRQAVVRVPTLEPESAPRSIGTGDGVLIGRAPRLADSIRSSCRRSTPSTRRRCGS